VLLGFWSGLSPFLELSGFIPLLVMLRTSSSLHPGHHKKLTLDRRTPKEEIKIREREPLLRGTTILE
jgi:hypothetical protein